MSQSPTGKQYHLTHGDYQVCVTQAGANLRSLRFRGDEILWTFDAADIPQDYQGAQLVPWPSRIRDGRYYHGGVTHQLPINEPERGVALHGLNRSLSWLATEHDVASLVQRTTLYPQPGWPGLLELSIRHELAATGLSVELTVSNVGELAAPFGYGTHPYFAVTDLSSAQLQLPFDEELTLDENLLPVSLQPIAADRDFRQPRAVAAAALDNSFTAPRTLPWRATLTQPGRSIEVWAEASMPWLQVYTRPQRDAIAIEPMTCGPDAFNHDDLGRIDLSPGETRVFRWGISVS